MIGVLFCSPDKKIINAADGDIEFEGKYKTVQKHTSSTKAMNVKTRHRHDKARYQICCIIQWVVGIGRFKEKINRPLA